MKTNSKEFSQLVKKAKQYNNQSIQYAVSKMWAERDSDTSMGDINKAIEAARQKKNVYIATVQIAIEANSKSEAEDAISECLTNNLEYNGAIIDWSYLYGNNKYTGLLDIGKQTFPVSEGELFEKNRFKLNLVD